jgi:hypothetical protein
VESRFIEGDVRTLTISNGDTLTVRARLNNGEARACAMRMCLPVVNGVRELDPILIRMARVTAYLLDWSLRDPSGKTAAIRGLPIRDLEQTLDQLAPEDFEEISDAIKAHEAAMTAERDAQKKTRSGGPMSDPISSSPPATAGGTNGSGISMSMSTSS